jgi:hypothetical protein
MENLLNLFKEDLFSINHKFGSKQHLDRKETGQLLQWIASPMGNKPEERICILTGVAGMGKSVVLHDVLENISRNGDIVYGLKSDLMEFENIDIEVVNELCKSVKYEAEKKERVVFLVDQIDALSQSLSSNRKLITEVNRLIRKLLRIPNVKVIVSCRPYDLNFDPTLRDYSHYKTISLGPLLYEEVKYILELFGKKVPSKESSLFQFLKIPLHLELFLEYGREDQEIVSLQSLFNRLWDEKILKTKNNSISSQGLIACLKLVVEEMYASSQLVCSKLKVENKYFNELEYLLTENILKVTSDNRRITFFHQSLFDYTYARIADQEQINVLGNLKKEHQGLFVRNRIKQYFSYLRESNHNRYISFLKETLVVDSIENGEYRFHIKMLLLTTLGSNEQISNEEKQFVGKYIIPNNLLRNVFVESVYSEAWFNYLVSTEYYKNGFKQMDFSKAKEIEKLCRNVIYINPEIVASLIVGLIHKGEKKWNEIWMRLVEGLSIIDRELNKELMDNLKDLYLSSKIDMNSLYAPHYLEKLASYDTAFVTNELNQYVIAKYNIQKKEKKDKIIGIKYIDNSVLSLIENVCENNQDVGFQLCINLIETIDTMSRFVPTVEADKYLYRSDAYIFFGRRNSYYDQGTLVDKALDYLEKKAKDEPQKISSLLERWYESNSCIFVYMTLYTLQVNPSAFKQIIYKILTDRHLMEEFSSNIDYQFKILLKDSWKLFSTEERNNILSVIRTIKPEYEKMKSFPSGNANYPTFQLGRKKQELLDIIPDKSLFTEEDYHLLREKEREFGKPNLTKPFQTIARSGWNSVPKKSMEQMSSKNRLNLFKKYNDDRTTDWTKPTLTGNGKLYEELVSIKGLSLLPEIETIISNKAINPMYAIYGIRGLCKAKIPVDVIINLVEKLITKIKQYSDVFDHAEWLMEIMRLADYFINGRKISSTIIDFLCYIAINYKEKIYNGEDLENEPNIYNTGVNRVRGCAVFYLVKCNIFKEYSNKIFSALESCKNATPDTKGAIIFVQALLNNLDIDRNFKLYLNLIKGYTPSLVSIPLSNYHPLLYFINTNFNDLQPIFKDLIKVEASHAVLSQILWIAWVRGEDGAKELLFDLLQSSNKARIELVKFFDEDTVSLYTDYVLPVVEYNFEYEDKELGNQVSFFVDDIVNLDWDSKVKPYINKYCEAKIFKFSESSFIDFLKKNTAQHPKEVLSWIEKFYMAHKDDDSYFIYPDILGVLTSAYDAIRMYDKHDETLEKAMDIMDIALRQENSRISLRRFFFELDNQ